MITPLKTRTDYFPTAVSIHDPEIIPQLVNWIRYGKATPEEVERYLMACTDNIFDVAHLLLEVLEQGEKWLR